MRRRARLRDGAWRRGARRGGALEPPTPCLARAANPSYGRCSNVVVANYWCVRNVRQCFLLPCPACSSATSGDGRDDELALIDTSKLVFADESLFWDIRRESSSARDASRNAESTPFQTNTTRFTSAPCCAQSKLKDRSLQPRCHLNAADAAHQLSQAARPHTTCVQPLPSLQHSAAVAQRKESWAPAARTPRRSRAK